MCTRHFRIVNPSSLFVDIFWENITLVTNQYYFLCIYQISKLSKLKYSLPILKQSHIIYHVSCNKCEEFQDSRKQQTFRNRRNEDKFNENIALYRLYFSNSSCY